jgi:hypothetical protein
MCALLPHFPAAGRADPSHPKLLVKSSKTGKEAVHKPGSCHVEGQQGSEEGEGEEEQ